MWVGSSTAAGWLAGATIAAGGISGGDPIDACAGILTVSTRARTGSTASTGSSAGELTGVSTPAAGVGAVDAGAIAAAAAAVVLVDAGAIAAAAAAVVLVDAGAIAAA